MIDDGMTGPNVAGSGSGSGSQEALLVVGLWWSSRAVDGGGVEMVGVLAAVVGGGEGHRNQNVKAR